MDPVSLVLAALAAGASAGATAGATEAVKSAVVSAYQSLKGLLKKAFGENQEANAALTLYERRPTEKVIVEALTEHLTAQVSGDPQIAAAAKKVLELAGPAATAEGSVAATVLQIHAETGGIAAGAINAPITMHYAPRGPDQAAPQGTGPGDADPR